MTERARLTLMLAGPVALAALIGFVLHGMGVPRLRSDPGLAPSIGDWHETAWPYGRDQFGPGMAYDCDLAVCRDGLRVAFRAKIGFCDCVRGVSDDAELDRVGDVWIVASDMAPGPPGAEFTIDGLEGRVRTYLSRDGSERALSIAFAHRCDVVVATATGGDAVAGQPAVLDFLRSAPAQGWARAALGM